MTGSRDKRLLMQDFRAGLMAPLEFNGPKQEICGLKWSPDGEYFAVGSNDNSMMVFSPKTRFAIMKKRHKAAVKAIAWSEKQRGILASGGGTADCTIKIWNIGSQVQLTFRQASTGQRKAHGIPNLLVIIFQSRERVNQHSRILPKRSRHLEGAFAQKTDFAKRTHSASSLPSRVSLWQVRCHRRR